MTTDTERGKLEFLWTEYKYRHDLCWRAVIQLTVAATSLAVLPYVNEQVVSGLGWAVLLVPLLGCVLAAFGWLMMRSELRALDRVKTEYRRLQDRYLADQSTGARYPRSRFGFSSRVLTYIAVLFLLGLGNIAVTASVWIPYVRATV